MPAPSGTTVELPPLMQAGYLRKRPRYGTGHWHARYFVLNASAQTLEAFDSQAAMAKGATHYLKLNRDLVVSNVFTKHVRTTTTGTEKSLVYCFHILLPIVRGNEPVITLGASSAEEAAVWKRALEQVFKISRESKAFDRSELQVVVPMGEDVDTNPFFAGAQPKPSELPGYCASVVRKHTGSYTQGADMEPTGAPLYAGNDRVPVLPVPDLNATLDLFLQSSKPHLSPVELQATMQAVEEMRGAKGQELQRRLLERAKTASAQHTSWFIDYWNDYAYLSYRSSLVHNVSYEVCFKDECHTAMSDPCRRAARFIVHALNYRKQVALGTLSPDWDAKSGLPMDNTQHKFLFNACRVPQAGKDAVLTYAPDVFGHIVVGRKGHFYAVDVCDESGLDALPLDVIEIQLKRVLKLADAKGPNPFPLGVLTCDDRDAWTLGRKALEKGNEAVLDKVQSAILLLCLDDVEPVSRRDVANHMLHGAATLGSRYWDKSLQIVVTGNGKMGCIAEHSMTDGMTVVRFLNTTLAAMFADPESSSALSYSAPNVTLNSVASFTAQPEPELLGVVMSPASQANVKHSELCFHQTMAKRDLEVLMFHGFGAEKIKGLKVSPDAFAQMAMQLAYIKTFGRCRATYEATQTKTYHHGRTEVTRVVSEESNVFCQSVLAGEPKDVIRAKLVKACEQHQAYISKASKALGVDRHLLGLKMQLAPGESVPALFNGDAGYTRSSHWAISTSGLVGELLEGWAFGEVVDDGVGIGYSVLPTKMRFSVTSAHAKEQWAERLCAGLEDALLLMAEVL